MMDKIGIITEVKDETVVVSLYNDEQCKTCGSNMCGSCTQTELRKTLFSPDCKKGDEIVVRMEADYRKILFFVYLLPVILLIAGYFAGSRIFQGSELSGIITSAVFFFISFPLIRFFIGGSKVKSDIVIIKKDGGHQ